MTQFEEREVDRLLVAVAACRDQADELRLCFAKRLLDMCLLEIAMMGNALPRESELSPAETLNALLSTKLRLTWIRDNKAVITS
ncbi:hypothetical protein [Aureimonas jatrophae]|jgi:hypothetical protein|uniref:Uncharacterized protein n=1 Tax=Aureimonas jatrophae TaxID=1166073 RepID=A0A1H0F939_9HYPH|nr:hypothetical protein [Aureimonas jatrophae]MBB3950120.1 hypothetical protein [Aureimonas jatrophae]SDN91178.1 hypothetical protein SAMN05192530_102416 [Aureimonas jatrophae]